MILVLQGRRPQATPLTVSVDTATPEAPVVEISGDLEFTSAAKLRVEVERLLAEAPPRIVLDFAQLRFMDSTGLSVIVQAWQEGSTTGTVIELRSTPRFLDTILDITGVSSLLARSAQGGQSGQSAASA